MIAGLSLRCEIHLLLCTTLLKMHPPNTKRGALYQRKNHLLHRCKLNIACNDFYVMHQNSSRTR